MFIGLYVNYRGEVETDKTISFTPTGIKQLNVYCKINFALIPSTCSWLSSISLPTSVFLSDLTSTSRSAMIVYISST